MPACLSAELDLRNQAAVEQFFAAERPDYVFLTAARVGGIYANDHYPADFIRDNLQIQTNVIDAAWRHGGKRLLFLSSSCIYPKYVPQPMPESCLLTGELEPINEWYAIAAIATDEALHGRIPDDVVAHLGLQRSGTGFVAERAPQVMLWGSGAPYREFLYVDDLAEACLFLMNREIDAADRSRLFNIGVGSNITIRDLAELVQRIVGFDGDVIWDADKPDGTPRKLMDVSRINALGWQASVSLQDGIARVYRAYCCGD